MRRDERLYALWPALGSTYFKHFSSDRLTSIAQSFFADQELEESVHVGRREVDRHEPECSRDCLAVAPGIFSEQRLLDDHAELVILRQQLFGLRHKVGRVQP